MASKMLFYYSVKKSHVLLCVCIPFVVLLCQSYDRQIFKRVRTMKETHLKYVLKITHFRAINPGMHSRNLIAGRILTLS